MNKYKKQLVAFYSTSFIAILGVGGILQDPKFFVFLGFLIVAFSILYFVNKLIYLLLGKFFPEESSSTQGGTKTHVISFDCNER